MEFNSNNLCVYTHSVEGKVFYVGMGNLYRPFQKTNRNGVWVTLVKNQGSLGYSIKIVQIFCGLVERRKARILEREQISLHKPVANLQKN